MTRTINVLSIWLGNLAAYVGGELVGEWIDMTQDLESIMAQFNAITNENTDEYFIADYDSDFPGVRVGEYQNIKSIKEMADRLEALADKFGDDLTDAVKAASEHTSSSGEMLDYLENHEFYFYDDCDNMTDVAQQVAEIGGYLDELPDFAVRYFDFEAFGRDLDIEGHFYYVGGSRYVEIV